MAIKAYAFTCGWLTLPASVLIAGEQGKVTVPVPVYLIEHPKGKLLFDTGLHVGTQTEPEARLGRLAGFHTVGFKPGEEVAARLHALGIAPEKIDYVVNSHLHFDHCGGNEQVPNATLLIQRLEWNAGHDADLIERVYYNPADYDMGHRVRELDGEFDVFGDGSAVIFPTNGHTPGHQSMRLRLDAGEVVLTGDACYLRRTLDELALPTAMFDREQMLESLRRLRAMRDHGAMIITGHDPEMWQTVAQAPSQLAVSRA
jgi:glyoxylase-like metal-dependent hydrolase (beta-lactamase superfamily II)